MSQLTESKTDLHFNHYGGMRLPFTCIEAKGLNQTMQRDNGEKLNVIDASGGYGSAALGAAHPEMISAITQSIQSYGYVTDELSSKPRNELLEYLMGPEGIWTNHFPYQEYHASGRNSGTEGMELALRLVLESRFDLRRLSLKKSHTERNIVVAFEGAWHGWSSGTNALLNRRHYKVGLPNFATIEQKSGFKVVHLPYGDYAKMEEFFAENQDKVLAVIIEPIQGDAGIVIPPKGYLRAVSELCSKEETLLVADEVLTFAKTGQFFAMRDSEGPIPTDITVIGKYLGMGVLSTSMVISRKELSLRSCGAVATSDLRPLTCGVIKSGIEYIIKNDLLGKSFQNGKLFKAKAKTDLIEAFPELFKEIRGTGFMYGIELTAFATNNLMKFRMEIIDNGTYVEFMSGCSRRISKTGSINPTMRIAPPLIAQKEDLMRIIEQIAQGARAFLEKNKPNG